MSEKGGEYVVKNLMPIGIGIVIGSLLSCWLLLHEQRKRKRKSEQFIRPARAVGRGGGMWASHHRN